MRRFLPTAALLLALTACGGSSPSSPSSPGPIIPQTLSGRLVATVDGGGLAGATVTAGSSSVTTDASGAFSLPAAGFPMTLTLQGPGFVTRGVTIGAAGQIAVDAFRLDGQFDLAFYRQLVRNNFDTGGLAQLRRRTVAPSIYLRTVDDAGAAMPLAQLDSTEAAIRSVAPLWTGGQFGVASVTRGSGAAPADAILVHWTTTADGVCGRTPSIGGDEIELHYRSANCSCNGVAVGPRAVKHELGHTFGYWHTANSDDVMFGRALTCDADPSPRERYHAALAYRRPAGNRDPDLDP